MTNLAKKARKSEVVQPDHAPFIDALGGPARVAEIINATARPKDDPITPEAVSMMKRRGVSWPYRNLLAEAARAANVPVPANFLGRGL